MRIISFVPFSAALEPTGRAVFLRCNFVSPRDQTLIERFVVTLGAKFARELTREFVAKIDILKHPPGPGSQNMNQRFLAPRLWLTRRLVR